MKFGVFEDDKLVYQWVMSTKVEKTSDELGLEIKSFLLNRGFKVLDIEDIVMSSVVPNMLRCVESSCKRYLNKKPYLVTMAKDLGIKNRYGNKKEVGMDRLVTASSAYHKYKAPTIVVDLGTAITVDYINKDGEYMGGAIAPGIELSSNALFTGTAKLPKIDLTKPKSVIGKTTRESMQSGIVYGYIGMIDFLIKKILEEENLKGKEVSIIGTGGFAGLISQHSSYINKIDKDLAMEGLRLIYDRNFKR